MKYIAASTSNTVICKCGKAHRSIGSAYRCIRTYPGTKIVSVRLAVGPDGIRARRQGILTPGQCAKLGDIDADLGLQYLRDWNRIGK
jgi:hypothetical protein